MSVKIPDQKLGELATEVRGYSESELSERYETALNRLPSRAPIYLPTEKMALPDRVVGVERVADIYSQRLKPVYQPALRALREKFAGQNRCFVIGNGPSLNLTDLSQLRNEVTFCVNSFFLKMPELDWVPTFYVVEDHLVAEDRAAAINALKGPTKLFPAYLGYCIEEADDTIFFNHRPRKSYPHGFDFTTDASEITYTGCTVTFTCMQLAHYLGFEEIYLIGVDASYDIPKDVEQGKDYEVGVLDMKSDDPNHFHPDYFGKGFRWHDPQVHKMLEAYEEAKKVTDELGRPIYNATVGGMLEVFERRPFDKIFPDAVKPEVLETALDEDDHAATVKARAELIRQRDESVPATRLSDYPKVLLLDMTRMGGGTATGELKSTLLRDWPEARVLQVYSNGRGTLGIGGGGVPTNREGVKFTATDEISELINRYDPDVVLYRPLADKPELHDFAMSTIADLGLPLVTWIMDDWPERLRHQDEAAFARFDKDLRDLFNSAKTNLSICQAMSDAFQERYGVEFLPFANAIDPDDWHKRGKPEPSDGDRLVIRYGGGLAPDMGLESVLRVARAVDRLSADYPISLEISTHPHWLKQSGDQFDGLRGVSIDAETRDTGAYFDWLSGADMLLIGYNFDETALRYVRYSMANKMPECLASATPLLVHGSKEIATVSYIDGLDCARIVDEPSDEAIEAELRWALAHRGELYRMGQAAREIAFERHNIADVSSRFMGVLRDAARVADKEDRRVQWSVVDEVGELIRNPKPLAETRSDSGRPKPEVYRVQAVAAAGGAVVRPRFIEEEAKPKKQAVSSTTPTDTPRLEGRGQVGGRLRDLRASLEFFRGIRGFAALVILACFSIPVFTATTLLERLMHSAPIAGVVAMLLLWSRIYIQLLQEAERVQGQLHMVKSQMDGLGRQQREAVGRRAARVADLAERGRDVSQPMDAASSGKSAPIAVDMAEPPATDRPRAGSTNADRPKGSQRRNRGKQKRSQRQRASRSTANRGASPAPQTPPNGMETVPVVDVLKSNTAAPADAGGTRASTSVAALTRVYGLGDATARQMIKLGVRNLEDLSAMTGEEVERLDAKLPGFGARSKRYKYVEQAAGLIARTE
jgi:predicted flap endonuclease-1-like 5' DNA nuclease